MKLTSCLLACILALPAHAEGRLHIYSWGEYVSPALIERFSARYGVEVTIDEYDSNETMLARVQGGNSGYDIVIPGDYAVQILIEQGLLEETRPDLMENFGNVDPAYVGVYWDPGRRFTVPWTVGFTGIAVNGTTTADMAAIFDPPPALSGRIAVLDDMVSVIHAAERFVGVPRCTSDRAELARVRDALMAARPHWRSFGADSINRLASGDADAALTWSGSVAVLRAQMPDVRFVYQHGPMEAFSDSLAVLKGAPNPENARLFLNFMMDPENAALTAEFAGYPVPVLGVEDHLSEKMRAAPELNPPAGVIAEFVPPCAPQVIAVYNAIWTEFRR